MDAYLFSLLLLSSSNFPVLYLISKNLYYIKLLLIKVYFFFHNFIKDSTCCWEWHNSNCFNSSIILKFYFSSPTHTNILINILSFTREWISCVCFDGRRYWAVRQISTKVISKINFINNLFKNETFMQSYFVKPWEKMTNQHMEHEAKHSAPYPFKIVIGFALL